MVPVDAKSDYFLTHYNATHTTVWGLLKVTSDLASVTCPRCLRIAGRTMLAGDALRTAKDFTLCGFVRPDLVRGARAQI